MSWAEVKKINSNLSEPLNVLIDEVKTLVTAVDANVGTINTNVTRGSIKRIQRGVVARTSLQDTPTRNISVSAVNTSKSILNISLGTQYFSQQPTKDSGISLANSTTISQTYYYSQTDSSYNPPRSWYNYVAFTWELIEFY